MDANGTLGPLALNYLAGIPEQYLFFRQQQLRHPASIYNLSLDRLGNAFGSVLDGYEKDTIRLASTSKSTFELNSLLQAQEHLLRCLQEHLDDCFLILKTLVDPSATKAKAAFASEYVSEAKLPGAKAFVQSTADYKTSLLIANKLKHNQSRLRGVGIFPYGGGIRLGYFLEEPDAAGTIGPSPEIHPDRGAFSFARDLKWRFFLVYSLSENLVKAVCRALTGLHQYLLPPGLAATKAGDAWNTFVPRLARVERAIFPKEQERSVATIRFSEDERALSIVFPDHIRIADPALRGGRIRAAMSTVGDGYSKSFKVPLP